MPSSAPSSAQAGRARRSPVQLVLAAGALAAAVGSIVGFGGTVASWLDGPPPGKVSGLRVQSAQPMTYGEALERAQRGAAETVPERFRRRPGMAIPFHLDTGNLTTKDVLPVRIILHDRTRGTSRTFMGQSVIGGDGDQCGCWKWIPVPRGRTRDTAEVLIFPAGRLKPGQQPIASDSTPEFTGSAA
jgi:hypothetical protein